MCNKFGQDIQNKKTYRINRSTQYRLLKHYAILKGQLQLQQERSYQMCNTATLHVCQMHLQMDAVPLDVVIYGGDNHVSAPMPL